MKKPDLSIVIPAYREEKRLGNTLKKLARFIDGDNFFAEKRVEVIVVSADSPDKTHSIAESFADSFEAFRLLKPGPRVGKGRDVRHGVLKAKGKVVVFMDADLATPLRYVKKFYALLENQADIVVGTRNLRKHHSSVSRRAVSMLGNTAFRVASGVWIEDSQCGFKMFNQKAAKICFSRLQILGWGFDMEVLTIAKANGLQTEVVRIEGWKNKPDGTFEDKIISNAVWTFADLAVIFGRRISGRYK